MKITAKEVALFAAYIFKISGITLNKSKGYLVENRLKPLLSQYGCTTYQDLYNRCQTDKKADLKREIIDAISTNETFFFRDRKPFDLLRHKIIPELIDRRQGQGFKKVPLRIWSAACSTGQEIYSIAMLLHEMLPNINDFDITILGTDISAMAVQRASYGKYNRFEIQRGLSEEYRRKYFSRQGDDWRIKDRIRVMAQFKKINLLHPFDDIRGMDVVFCRNVAIYFSPADKKRLFTNIAKVMTNDGALIVGGSETLTTISSLFKSQQYLRTIYYTHSKAKDIVSVAKHSPVKKTGVGVKKIAAKACLRTTPAPLAAVVSSPPPPLRAKATPRQAKPPPQILAPVSQKRRSLSPAKVKKTSLLAQLSNKQDQEQSPLSSSRQATSGTNESLLAVIAKKNKPKE